ncbi:proline dehydrogenase family protein [Luteococcus sp. Sow4_B9]|uniref:proline dehydrogenase family protein n=1 Tax=Luteococcus sp. Sow4_B9 TaxID=3438792 RepID=UPI003F95C503
MSDREYTRPFGTWSALLKRAGESERTRRLVTGTPAAREVARRFVAAETTDAALDLVAANRDKGLLSTVELLLPAATDVDTARGAARAQSDVLARVGELGLGPQVELTVAPATLGQGIVRDGHQISTDLLDEVCRAADNAGARVTLDLADHTTTDDTFATFTELHQDHPQLGVTVQAQLRRSLADSRWLSGIPARVRLCKGAYSEPRSISYDDHDDIAENYLSCLNLLMAGRGYPMVATHDPDLVQAADDLAFVHNRRSSDYEIQMYHGVRPWEHRRLADTGHAVRVHLPVGEDWYAYFAQRISERPANVMPLLRALVTRR